MKKFEATLKQLGKRVEIKIYPDAGHAFENPNNKARYRPDDAADAWKRTIVFLADILSRSEKRPLIPTWSRCVERARSHKINFVNPANPIPAVCQVSIFHMALISSCQTVPMWLLCTHPSHAPHHQHRRDHSKLPAAQRHLPGRH